MYNTFIFGQSALKFVAFGKAKSADKKSSFNAVKYGEAGRKYGTLVADRTVGNMMEQSVVFLVILTLHACLVDVSSAVHYGWIWLVSRAYYPYAFYKRAPILFLSTFPGYYAILCLMFPLVQMVI